MEARERAMPWFRSLQWSWFIGAMILVCKLLAIDNFLLMSSVFGLKKMFYFYFLFRWRNFAPFLWRPQSFESFSSLHREFLLYCLYFILGRVRGIRFNLKTWIDPFSIESAYVVCRHRLFSCFPVQIFPFQHP